MKTTAKTFTVLAVCLAAVALTMAVSADDEKRHVRVLDLKDCAEGAVFIGEDGPRIMGLGHRGHLGVELTTLTPELRRHFGVPEELGIMVSRVQEDSPAAAAGLAVGDIITRLGDEDVGSIGRLTRLVRGHEPEETVEIEYWRDGEAAFTSAVLDEQQRCGIDISTMIDLESLPHIEFKGLEDIRIDLEGLPHLDEIMELHEFDAERLGEARERLHEALEGQDWEMHLDRLKDVDMEGIHEQLREVMERLQSLEHEIHIERHRVEDHDEGESDEGGSQIH